MEETMGALAQAVRQGKALYVGISNYTAKQTFEAAKILRGLGVPCLIHQPKYSLFERWVEDGLLDVLEKEGIGCIPFSPLAQGQLTDRYLQGIPEGSRASKGFFLKPEMVSSNLNKVIQLNEIAQSRGQKLSQMALAWVLRDQRITSVLIGASSVAQLEENVQALNNLHFSGEELKNIDRVLFFEKAATKRELRIPPSSPTINQLIRTKQVDKASEKDSLNARRDFIKNIADKFSQ